MNIESIWTRFAWGKAALLVFSFLFLINILILDIKVFTRERESAVITPTAEKPQVEVTTPSAKIVETTLCPEACLEAISEAISPGLAQATPTPEPTTSVPTVKEFYIPLGTGLTTSTTWVELPGVESVIDMANYPNVKSIIFEASMRIPTANGRVYAKLYNVTDKHDVWESEVYAEGPSGYRAESGNITLSSGRKLYRVIMKSTMGYEAILDSARIKILLE